MGVPCDDRASRPGSPWKSCRGYNAQMATLDAAPAYVRRRRPPSTPPPELSVDEVCERFAGQWILMNLIDDGKVWPAAGRLLAHSRSKPVVSRARRTAATGGAVQLLEFQAGPVYREVHAWRKALAENEDPDAYVSVNGW